ncbi:hypothetical protein M0R45_021349 [Rubus argutus]|uniref:Uncharacterized protein n=1 Tax=Rubus argutus TaxID=59490 RepID=A0AAW1XC43_RUBAR
MLVQEGRGNKACTSAHGVAVATAAPELVLKSLSGLIKDVPLSDPEKLDAVISSGSSKGLDGLTTWNDDIMPRAASFGSRPFKYMHQCVKKPLKNCGFAVA